MQAPPAMAIFAYVIARLRQRLAHVSARSWRNLFALLAPFLLGLLLFLLLDGGGELTPERMQAQILALGGVGLLGYLIASALRPVFVLVSGSLFSVAAGMVWGPWWGTALALFGSLLSTAMVFCLARALGRGVVRDLAGERWQRLAAMAERRGFAFVFVATLGFALPTDLVIAVAASTGVRTRTALAATALGSLPGTVAMVVLGATVSEPSAAPWWIGGGAVLGLSVLALALARWWFPRLPGTATPAPAAAQAHQA